MNRMLPIVVVLGAGAIFGAGLAVSGMTDPARVIGFLDVAGDWDPALVFVMGGAVGTYAVGMAALRAVRRGRGCFGTALPARESEPIISWRLGIGAAIFGAGWGLGGFCPGPSLANLGALRMEAIVFVPAMAAGMLVAQRFFGADRPGRSPCDRDTGGPACDRAKLA